jgi:hypothetical protein
MANAYDGKIVERGEDGYEEARCAAVWNARTPERYPEVIVIARSEEDVLSAVPEARNTRFVRSRALPKRLPSALARHCAEEYVNLAALLPEL